MGIGIAHGRAIAGKIGTTEQIKVGAFGPTVNLGARLEGLTKTLNASILMDEATAEYAREALPTSEGRLRRMGRFRPAGLDQELTLTQLLPPAELDATVTDDAIALYQTASELFEAGNWRAALNQLKRLSEQDLGKDFLKDYISQNHVEPPPKWNGVIVMQSK